MGKRSFRPRLFEKASYPLGDEGRRTFLRTLIVGGAALLGGCGDRALGGDEEEPDFEHYGGVADVMRLDGGPPPPDAGGAPPMDAALDQRPDAEPDVSSGGTPDMMMAPLDAEGTD
jgi:hypothetical protein